MSNLEELTNKRLQKLIDETQLTLDELKQEAERRKHVKQEDELMDLDNHFKSAELSLATIRNFINYLVQDSHKKS